MNALFVTGRILFGGFFVVSGINHFMQLGTTTQFVASKGVPAPTLAVVLTGLLLLLGAWPRIGIALIVLFLVPTSFLMHDFWAIADPMQSMAEQTNFMKNLALAGGALMLMAVPLPWAKSWPRVDRSGNGRWSPAR